jgi:hypothetical protein
VSHFFISHFLFPLYPSYAFGLLRPRLFNSWIPNSRLSALAVVSRCCIRSPRAPPALLVSRLISSSSGLVPFTPSLGIRRSRPALPGSTLDRHSGLGLQVVIVYCSIMLSIDECILNSQLLTWSESRVPLQADLDSHRHHSIFMVRCTVTTKQLVSDL